MTETGRMSDKKMDKPGGSYTHTSRQTQRQIDRKGEVKDSLYSKRRINQARWDRPIAKMRPRGQFLFSINGNFPVYAGIASSSNAEISFIFRRLIFHNIRLSIVILSPYITVGRFRNG